jgi:hypothetical protein
MSDAARVRYLRVALIAVGVIFVLGIYPLAVFWPTGWAWGQGHSHYAGMIVGLYATLGVFLVFASQDPMHHTSLIWFTVWSNVVHAAIMAAQTYYDPLERGHLYGDIPGLVIIAVVLGALTPWHLPAPRRLREAPPVPQT